jgi:hypothetical protein
MPQNIEYLKPKKLTQTEISLLYQLEGLVIK